MNQKFKKNEPISEIISSIHEKSLTMKPEKGRFLDVLIVPVVAFFKYFIFRGGMVFGTKGFVISVLASLEAFILYGNAYLRGRT